MNRLKQHVAAKMPMPADGDVRSYQSALARETRATLQALREGQLRPSRRKMYVRNAMSQTQLALERISALQALLTPSLDTNPFDISGAMRRAREVSLYNMAKNPGRELKYPSSIEEAVVILRSETIFVAKQVLTSYRNLRLA